MMRKIGRNERCPCGSGQKYKRCHGAVRPMNPQSRRMSPEEMREMQQFLEQTRAADIERERQHGRGRPFVSFDFGKHKLVAVGNEVHWSERWKTVPDFLMSY